MTENTKAAAPSESDEVKAAHSHLLDLVLSRKYSGDSLQRAIRALIAAARASGQTSEATPDGLLPCPFCGGTNMSLHKNARFPDAAPELQTDELGAFAYAVSCDSCAAESGWAKSESGARRWWNTRIPAAAPVEHGEDTKR